MDSTQRTRPRVAGSPVGMVIFIILTVLFAILAYWSFANYQSTAEQLRTTKGTLTVAESARQKAAETIAAFQKATGVDSPDSLKDFIRDTLKATTAEGYGAGVEETAKDALKTALHAISQLKIALDTLNSTYNTEVAAHKSLEDAKKAGDEAYQKEVEDKTAEIQALQKTLADEKESHETSIKVEVDSRERLREQYYFEQDKWKDQEVKYVLHIAELQQKLGERSGEGIVIEKASGYITHIDLRNNLASVNIGKSSGVRPGMRFVVFSRDPSGKQLRKGVLEITRVDERVSVGRVVATEAGMAVGKNDYVFNLAGPTRGIFVFAGEPKLYTLEQWTNFVRANGGEVAAEVRKGDQVADYLILPYKDPREEPQPEDPAITKLIFDARDFGVRIMKEPDLKTAMGLK